MRTFHCAICQNKVRFDLVCASCQAEYDIEESWARKAIELERENRNSERRFPERRTITFTDYEKFVDDGKKIDGWVMADEYWTGDYYDEEAGNARYFEQLLDRLCRLTKLTGHQRNTLKVYIWGRNPHSEKAAQKLSSMEGKVVTADAYRRRLADIRRKLKNAIPRL